MGECLPSFDWRSSSLSLSNKALSACSCWRFSTPNSRPSDWFFSMASLSFSWTALWSVGKTQRDTFLILELLNTTRFVGGDEFHRHWKIFHESLSGQVHRLRMGCDGSGRLGHEGLPAHSPVSPCNERIGYYLCSPIIHWFVFVVGVIGIPVANLFQRDCWHSFGPPSVTFERATDVCKSWCEVSWYVKGSEKIYM